MGHVDRMFSEQDRQAVNQAVRDAETQTSAEIIPVVAGSSGRYDRAEDLVGLWAGLLALLVVWAVYPPTVSDPAGWDGPQPLWQFIAYAGAIVVAFVLGVWLATRFDGLRRLFTPRQQMQDEVAARARLVFFDQRVHHTTAGSGVLLYVSLYEHMATVLADQSVLERLGQDRIETLCQQFVERLHRGTPTAALCETAREVGQQLAPLLPRQAGSVNELPDALVVLD
jgi:putative membrane protein